MKQNNGTDLNTAQPSILSHWKLEEYFSSRTWPQSASGLTGNYALALIGWLIYNETTEYKYKLSLVYIL